jgi:hypothetical protein
MVVGLFSTTYFTYGEALKLVYVLETTVSLVLYALKVKINTLIKMRSFCSSL